jgi:hypothetical protein
LDLTDVNKFLPVDAHELMRVQEKAEKDEHAFDAMRHAQRTRKERFMRLKTKCKGFVS